MFCETFELGIGTRAGKDLRVARRDHSSTLSLECARHDRSTAAFPSALNDFVDERDKIVRETHSDLLTHTRTVPAWEQGAARGIALA